MSLLKAIREGLKEKRLLDNGTLDASEYTILIHPDTLSRAMQEFITVCRCIKDAYPEIVRVPVPYNKLFGARVVLTREVATWNIVR